MSYYVIKWNNLYLSYVEPTPLTHISSVANFVCHKDRKKAWHIPNKFTADIIVNALGRYTMMSLRVIHVRSK